MMQKGFSLLQVMIYCAGVSLLSAVLFKYAAHTNRKLSMFTTHVHDCGMLLAAHDVCMRDLMMGNSEPEDWHEGENGTTWMAGDQAFGWLSTLNRIERIVGRFDMSAQQWIKSSKGLAAKIDDADCCVSPVEKNNRVTHVELSISGQVGGKEIAFNTSVAPRNRVV